MLLINNKLIAVFFLFSILFVGSIGILGYIFLTNNSLKTQGELVFFMAVVAIILLLFFWIILISKARRKTASLQNMLDIARMSGKIDETRFAKFGNFGTKLSTLFYETEEISQKRAHRIKFLNGTISKILSITNHPILILDAAGTIIVSSPGYIESFAPAKGGILGVNIEELQPKIDFAPLTTQMIQTHRAVNIVTEEYNAELIPIYGVDLTPDGYIANFSKPKLSDKIATSAGNFMGQVNNAIENAKVSEKQDIKTINHEIADIKQTKHGLFSSIFKKKS